MYKNTRQLWIINPLMRRHHFHHMDPGRMRARPARPCRACRGALGYICDGPPLIRHIEQMRVAGWEGRVSEVGRLWSRTRSVDVTNVHASGWAGGIERESCGHFGSSPPNAPAVELVPARPPGNTFGALSLCDFLGGLMDLRWMPARSVRLYWACRRALGRVCG